MDDVKKRFCKLCLATTTNDNFQEINNHTKEILYRLKLNCEVETKHVICDCCSKKMYSAFNFRSICLNTDKDITTHVHRKAASSLDLRDLYMKRKGINESTDTLDDIMMCRLCLQRIEGKHFPIDENQVDMLQKFIPEMNLNVVKGPVLCELCQDSLTIHSRFTNKCLELQGNIKNKAVPLIKSEDIDIKLEGVQNEEFVEPELIKIECEKDVKIVLERVWYEDMLVKPEYAGIKSKKDEHESGIHDLNQENPSHVSKEDASKAKTYKNESESSATLTYNSVTKMFKCGKCTYESKYKYHVKRHLLTHRERPRPTIIMYKCEHCDYENRLKSRLELHKVKHKDNSEAEMYNCGECGYQTKYKSTLTRHLLKHSPSKQVVIYKCELMDCNYTTKDRRLLARHVIEHDKSEMYTCNKCDFQTNYKSSFVCHLLRHESSTEIQTFKCEKCDFETRHKKHLKPHLLKHREEMYKCDVCAFETKYKATFNRHELIHKDRSEVKMYKCEQCDYESLYKRYLTCHLLKHKDPSEVEVYKCASCDYQTKYKKHMKRHLLKHMDLSKANLKVKKGVC